MLQDELQSELELQGKDDILLIETEIFEINIQTTKQTTKQQKHAEMAYPKGKIDRKVELG